MPVPGQRFGPRYHIKRLLGAGGMGAVYEALDEELGVHVALKVIRPDVSLDPSASQHVELRFKRELLLARQVTHRNVVRIHDLGDVDGIKYISMSLVDGLDLATTLRRFGALPVPQALRVAKSIAAGLLAAHQSGVVHRDLKPANVMMEREGGAVIMDFGIAGASGVADASHGPAVGRSPILGHTLAGRVAGTVPYMAPEQARGDEVDHRADIYAFGLIVYDMLTPARLHLSAKNPTEELASRMESAPAPIRSLAAGVPQALERIITRCVQPRAEDRYQSTGHVIADLEALDESGHLLPIMRRVSRRTLGIAAVMVAVLLGGTFYLANRLAVPPKPPDLVSVVIADVVNTTGNAAFDHAIGQTFRRALEDASFISAYNRSRLPSMGLRAVPALDEGAAREVAVKQGLGVVLASAIAPDRDGYLISARATEAVAGREIIHVSGRASNQGEVLATSATLMARVRRVLGDTTSESAQMFAMRSVSTSSLEVLSHYAAAAEAQARGRWDDARKSLLRAVELDPNFGLGYQGLSAVEATLGRQDEAKNYIDQALRHVDNMTERERFFTRGAYYRLHADYRACAKEYGELLARYPADAAARGQRAACLVYTRNLREALAENQQALKMLPNHAAFRMNLVLMSYRAGEFQLVEDEVTAMPQPDSRVLLALAYSQLARGLPRDAEATYKRVATVDPANAWAQSGLGDLLVYEGHFSAAVPVFEKAASADLANKNPNRAAIKLLSVGNAHLLGERYAAAATAAATALEHSTLMAVRFLAAQIFVETGAIEKAQELATALTTSTENSDDARVHGKIIAAQIALKQQEPRRAIQLLTDANNVLDTWLGHFNLGRAYFAAGMFVQADSEFDLCVTRRGEALTVMEEGPTYGLFPVVYYYQGRVREALKTKGFADSYREYLKIRSGSTEDPLLPDIRRRLGN